MNLDTKSKWENLHFKTLKLLWNPNIIAKGEEGGNLMRINGNMLLLVVDLAEAFIEMQFLVKSDRQEFLSFCISYAFLLFFIANATYVGILSRNYYSGYYITKFVRRCATKDCWAINTRIVTTMLESQVEPRRKWKGCLCAKRHTDINTFYCCNAASRQLASCKNLRFPWLRLRLCLAYLPV